MHPPQHTSTSERPIAYKHSVGFTLIEIMVVFVIVAIMASVTIITFDFGGTPNKQLKEEARRLYQLARITSDKAVFRSTQYGIRFTQKGYTFYALDKPNITLENSSEDEAKNAVSTPVDEADGPQWKPMNESPLREHQWPEGLSANVYIEGQPIVLEAAEESAEEPSEGQQFNDDINPPIPQWIFLSNSETIPDTAVHLSREDSDQVWRIGLNDDGLLEYAELDN